GTLRAHFMVDQIVLAAVSGVGGTTTPAGNNLFPRNSVQTVTATPDQGYSFAFWTGDVLPAEAANPVLTVTLTAPKTVKANFRAGYVISDVFGLTVKKPSLSWAAAAEALKPGILAGNPWPQKGTVVETGSLDVLPNWLQSTTIDGTAVAEWRKHYWTHLVGTDDDGPHTLPTNMVEANTSKRAAIPFLTLTTNTIPAETIRFDFPVIEVAEDPVVLDVPSPGMLYIPGPQTPEEFAANRYFVLATANGLPSPISVDGVKNRPTHTADTPGLDVLPGNEDTFRLTASHPANLSEINMISLAARDLEVTPASAKMFLQVGADGQHLEFNPPKTYTSPVKVTYYVTLTRGTGLIDPENLRTKGLARHYVAADGNSSDREPCWKNSEGYITCWGQLTLKSSGSNSVDPMQLGASVRGTAPRSGDFTALYNQYINDVYPGGERVSGVSAYYILRTIACYFIPGKVSKASVAYQCEGNQSAFNSTASSNLCADPNTNGYQRCIDGSCDWYAYVPANVSCQPSPTTSANWDSVAGQTEGGGSSFVSLVGTTVQMDQVLASGVQTCVKLPCPKRTANCTP
ncbi:MAG: InlB B-repeat-containing protein, partial [bacterium]